MASFWFAGGKKKKSKKKNFSQKQQEMTGFGLDSVNSTQLWCGWMLSGEIKTWLKEKDVEAFLQIYADQIILSVIP